MKKRILLVSAVLVLVLVCLAACSGLDSTLTNINKFLKNDYSKVTVNVTTQTSKVTLNGVYNFSFDGDTTTVEYSYDKLNELNASGDNADSFKSTVTGTAVVENGKVTSNGDSVDLPLGELDFTGLSFKEGFFAKTTVTPTTFEADVTNPKGFVGNSDFVCSDMHVKAQFTNNSLTKIEITYVSSDYSNVTISYTFTK